MTSRQPLSPTETARLSELAEKERETYLTENELREISSLRFRARHSVPKRHI